MIGKNGLMILLILLCFCEIGNAQDYLRLTNGKVVHGAIIRTDSATVFLANWEERHEQLPQLRVFTKEEIESIWFHSPPKPDIADRRYRPHEGGYEIGGAFFFQTIKDSASSVRLLQLSVFGGYTLFPFMSLEAEADFTFPGGNWGEEYQSAYHFATNVLFHPSQAWGPTPFVLIGGGASSDVPLDRIISTTSKDSRNLLNMGVGIKWGVRSLGLRLEYRYRFFEWTPDDYIPIYENGIRVGERRADRQEAFSNLIRFGLFFYR